MRYNYGSKSLVYLVNIPTPYRNAELDYVARGLGNNKIHAVFLNSFYPAGGWRPQFPKECSYYCLNNKLTDHKINISKIGQFYIRKMFCIFALIIFSHERSLQVFCVLYLSHHLC